MGLLPKRITVRWTEDDSTCPGSAESSRASLRPEFVLLPFNGRGIMERRFACDETLLVDWFATMVSRRWLLGSGHSRAFGLADWSVVVAMVRRRANVVVVSTTAQAMTGGSCGASSLMVFHFCSTLANCGSALAATDKERDCCVVAGGATARNVAPWRAGCPGTTIRTGGMSFWRRHTA
jgi:hypothetical protein